MSKRNRFSSAKRITAPSELLEAAVAYLLGRVPEVWQEYCPDELTETQEQALFLLTAAGMVERRERLRLRMANHPMVVEATVTVMGEYGAVEAFERLAAQVFEDWKDSFCRWKESDAATTTPVHCERLKPSEWRLAKKGIIAQKDLAAGRQAAVLDFALKRGIFDGKPRMIGGRLFRREPVRGHGSLVKMRKIEGEQATHCTVSISNWVEGAEAFGGAFGPLSEAMQAKGDKAKWSKPTSKRQAAIFLGVSVDKIHEHLKANPKAVRKISRELWAFDRDDPLFVRLP